MDCNNWEQFLKQNGNHCVVYGAGIVARIFADAIFFTEEQEYNIDFFAVSGKPEVSEYYFIPVKTFNTDEIDCNTAIVVATRENVQEEILLHLKELGYNNVYNLKWKEFIKLQRDSQRTALGELSEFRREFKLFLDSNNRKVGNYIDIGFDKSLLYDDFCELSKNEELLCKLVDELVQGLEDKSKAIVYQLLDRFNKIICNHTIGYVGAEKDELIDIQHSLNDKIYKISNDKYVYENIYLPIKHFLSTIFIYHHGLVDVSNLDYIQNKDIIDAGAYIGDSALVLSNYTNGNVHSFEADPNTYLTMKKTLEMNTKKNIIPVNLAISEYTGYVDLAVLGDNHVGNFIVDSNNDGIETMRVPCTSIDDYVKKNNLQIGFIKTDVEGAEQLLLKGAINTLKTQKPTLSISIYHNIDDFFKIKPWIESLGLGYKFKISRPMLNFSFIGDVMLICEIDK